MPAPVRVLVVDDSALTRQILVRALDADPGIDVVGTAADGLQAIEQAKALKPDVVTLDIEMPQLSGLEALPYLRRDTDARIVVLSSFDDPDTTYRALEAGAVDFIPKPRQGLASGITDLTEPLVRKLKMASRVAPSTLPAPSDTALGDLLTRPAGQKGRRSRPHADLPASVAVAMAASTGGPLALERIFSALTADLPAAFLVVQHLPPGFSESLAGRLQRMTDIEVVEARPHMAVRQGRAYVAPGGKHMQVRRLREGEPRIHLYDGAPVHGVRPAGDPLFESVARVWGSRAVGVVLTGMGADGAEGLRHMVAEGGAAIVQDEATSVVWGMPGAAVRAGVAQRVVPVTRVASEIRRAVEGRR